jgi:hypothetical protein
VKTLITTLLLVGICCFVFGQVPGKKSAVIGTMVSKPDAILVLSPPNSDQGFLLPQLTGSQRQAVTPTSPDEDGLIVFDTTDKSFYYWKNNAWVKGLGTDAAAAPNLVYDATTQKLSLSSGGEVNLSALKEIPVQSGNTGKFLTTDGITLSWATVPALGDITNIIAGAGLSGGATSGEATLSVNTDGITLTTNGSNQLELKDGAVTSAKLGAGAVTPAAVASGGINKVMTTDAVGAVTWVDQATIGDKQNLALSGNVLNIDNGTSANLNALTAGGQLSGTLNNLALNNNVVTATQLADNAVDAAALQAGAVVHGKIGAGAVDANAIQSGAVTTTHINSGGNSKVLTTNAGGVVTWADRNSFTDDNQNLSLTSNTLNIDNGTAANLNNLAASGQVAGALNNLAIQNDVVTSAHIATDAVGVAELANGAVDASAIQSGVVSTAHLASGGNSKVLSTDATGVVTWSDRTTFTDGQNLSLTGNTLNIDNGTAANLNNLAASGQVAGALNNLAIQNDVVTSAHIAIDAVGVAELANGAVDASAIQSGVVSTTHLASGGNSKVLSTDATGVVTWSDRTTFTDGQNLSLTGNTLNIDNGTAANLNNLAASGQVVGTLNNLAIQNDVVTSAHIVADAIGVSELANGAVDAAAIQNDVITATHLATDAVGAAELANGAVDAAAIQSGVVSTTHLASGGNSKVLSTDASGVVTWSDRTSFTDGQNLSLTGNTLNIDNGTAANLSNLTASGQVAGALNNLAIQNDVVTSAHIATDAVGAAELANGAVDATAIQSGVVGTTHIASGGNSKVLSTDATGVVTWSDRTSFTDAQNLSLSGNTLNIVNGSAANLNNLTASGQVAGVLNNLVVQNDAITSAHLANDAVGASELANGSVDAAAIENDVITSTQLANDAVGAAELANNAVDANAIQTGVVNTTHLASGGNNKVMTTNGTGVVNWADRTALPVTGDVTGTLGASTVAKIQGRDVATTSPGNGEALVWNGSAWAPQPIAVTPTTQYYSIDPSNFAGMEPPASLGFFQADNTFVTGKGPGGKQIMAPVNLPHNASIDGITVYYLNNDLLLVGTITVTLYRKSFLGSNQQLATSTLGISVLNTSANLPAIPAANRVVDNSAYSYRILVTFTDPANGPGILDAVQRIYGIRIQYSK